MHGHCFHRAVVGPLADSAADTVGEVVPSLRPGPGSQHSTAGDVPLPDPSAPSDPELLYISAQAGGKKIEEDKA